MSEIKNVRLGHYGTEHSKCNQMTKLGFKGLISCFRMRSYRNPSWSQYSGFIKPVEHRATVDKKCAVTC